MSSSYAYPVQQPLTPIYQCEAQAHHTLHSVKEHLRHLCAQNAHQLVKVETMDGDCHEGHIVFCDRSIVYLRLSHEGHNRAFPPNPYSNAILPLVLFDLLAITLV
ncbi:hypothetical protein M3223_19310 [Paenibacillus pasadenensis]|uniref:hypothetical protein n=1 Tax=Paenibacillus pasadenensis TaxID=217090 RepID=UPI00203A4DED|nr:hypothetical protein [Paenibacillus pasadenensis]MCM3749505.1 hypothetical protein [Paenibacillus pasadenensis]